MPLRYDQKGNFLYYAESAINALVIFFLLLILYSFLLFFVVFVYILCYFFARGFLICYSKTKLENFNEKSWIHFVIIFTTNYNLLIFYFPSYLKYTFISTQLWMLLNSYLFYTYTMNKELITVLKLLLFSLYLFTMVTL